MAILLYTPGVRIVVETTEHGIIDVTDDIENGSLNITENSLSTLTFTLLNHRRKYDGVFTPNDLVSVQMKRLRWMPVFSGYLNQVPYFSVYPRSIPLTASCTLKRLRYRLWDMGTEASTALLVGATDGNRQDVADGGLRDKIIALLTEVGEWPKNTIHIGAVPQGWAEKTESLREQINEIAPDPSSLGLNSTVGGSNIPSDLGTKTVEAGGPGTGALPYMNGKVSWFGGPVGGAYGLMQLTGEPGTTPRDDWYVAMRWPYAEQDSLGGTAPEGMTSDDVREAKNWWRNRKILVAHRESNRAIVVRAADWGPRLGTGKGIDISKHALEQGLKAKTGDMVDVRFADPDAPLGIVDTSGQSRRQPGGNNPPATTPETVQGASGVRFTGVDSLKGNTAAARSFIQANWQTPYGIGGYAKRNVAGTGTPSDHSLGLALDVMVSKGRAMGNEEAKGNAIAMWFAANPEAFGVKYIIWNDRFNNGSGWVDYTHPSYKREKRSREWVLANGGDTLQHRDHVHISFKNTGQTDLGPMGSGWPGSLPVDFQFNTLAGAGLTPVGEGGGGIIGGITGGLPLTNAYSWEPRPDWKSSAFSGPRALMNDTPLLYSIRDLCQASMRSFMSAPNGDFISWFPDYFDQYGIATKITIQDIELDTQGFTIQWDDTNLITHQFVTGAKTPGIGGSLGGVVEFLSQTFTQGIASIEFPELMEALFNINPDDPRAASFADPEAILQRFGARVSNETINTITGPEAEFWYACQLFRKNWAAQFSAEVKLTFMPEIWPGMLIHLPTYGFQAYVEAVSHSFDFSGGFTTSVRIIAPSSTDTGKLYALPRAGTGGFSGSGRGSGSGGGVTII